MNFSSVTPRTGRPGSAKPQTTRNPITGEETPVRTASRADSHADHQSRQPRRQESIPGLNLQYLKETEDYVYKPIEIADYPLQSPNDSARTDVSWGTEASTFRSYRQTPRQSARSGRSSRPAGMPGLTLEGVDGYDIQETRIKPTTPRTKKATAWDKPPLADPDSYPAPSDKQKQMYREYEAEMKTSYKEKNKTEFTEEEIQDAIDEVKEKHPALDFNREDIVEKSWTKRQNQATDQYLKRMDAEELCEYNKKLKLVETVMVDQLSRAVISDPEQNSRGQSQSEMRRPRGSNRSLHDSKIRTVATATENLLSQRVRFGARVLTRNGHDAIRELTGFFFSMDNTFTIYEFRQFGKSAKALPFLSRGRFRHLRGPREGEPYSIVDLCCGHEILVPTAGQHTLPETLKRLPEVTFRITDVDEEEKRRILLNGVPSIDKEDVYARLHIPNKQEYTEKMVLKSIQSNVQKKIKKRAIKTITGLGNFYRKTDSSGKGILYRFELEKGLFDFHIDLPPDTLDALFEILDYKESGELDYSVYMRAVLGSMIEARKSLVRKAFCKIDTGKKGYLTINDIQKFFNSTFRGDRDEVGPLQAFLNAVLPNKKCEEVSFSVFEEYYEGLSLGVPDDEDFFNIVRNTWTL